MCNCANAENNSVHVTSFSAVSDVVGLQLRNLKKWNRIRVTEKGYLKFLECKKQLAVSITSHLSSSRRTDIGHYPHVVTLWLTIG